MYTSSPRFHMMEHFGHFQMSNLYGNLIQHVMLRKVFLTVYYITFVVLQNVREFNFAILKLMQFKPIEKD